MAKPFHSMFLNDLGHSWRVGSEECVGEIGLIPELCVAGAAGVPHVGVLASLADIVSGSLANKSVAPRIPLTVDLTLHLLRPVGGDRIKMTARTLKVGRSTTVAETVFESGPEPFAISHTTFMVSPRPEDVMEEVFWHRPATPPRLDGSIMEQIGAVVVRPGVVELARVPYVMQPSGTIQGGAVALIAELAASTALEGVVSSLEIRYVSAVRVGPARTSSTVLGPGVARVEVRDTGNEDRLTALAIARTSRQGS